MKQASIGLFVIVVVTFYGLWVRQAQQPAPVATAPASASVRPDAAPRPTSAGSESTMPTPAPTPAASAGQYKDGTFTGSAADAFYGNVQVSATITGGRVSSVAFLQYPSDHDTSVMINQQAMPLLKQEAVQAQNAQVQIVSGATFTSRAFIQSLTGALSQARA